MADTEDTTLTEVLTGFKSAEIIERMSEWLQSCEWGRDRAPKGSPSKYEIIAYVQHYYPGGASGFLDDMGAEVVL